MARFPDSRPHAPLPPPGTDLTVVRPRPAALAARCAPPLAAWLLLALLAVYQADRAGAAETAYLALWIVAVLLPAAALAPAPAWESTLGAPLAALAAWALPAGPARSAAVGALLVAALAIASARALGTERHDGRRARDVLALTLPLALGAQALLRGELLLAPGLPEVAALVALPAIGAGALALLAARRGLAAALLAGAAAVTLGPGWTGVTALAIAGAALGAEIRPWIERAGGGSLPRGWSGGSRRRKEETITNGSGAAPHAGAPAAPIGSWLAIGLLLAVLAGGLATESRAAATALAAAAVIAWPRMQGRARVLALLFAAGLPAAAALARLRLWPEAFGLLAWVPILLPVLAFAPALPRSRRVLAVAALGVAAAGGIAVPGPAAPAAGLAALAVLLTERRRSEGGERSWTGTGRVPESSHAEPRPAVEPTAVERPRLENRWSVARTAQGVWSAALLAGTALLASYPWLRPAPAADALALVGLAPGWAAAAGLAALALAIGLGFGAPAVARRLGGRRPAAWATAIALGAALFAALPPPARPAFTGAAALVPQQPRLVIELDGSPVRTVAVVSNLSGAAELAAGTEVASVRLLDAGGEPLARRLLRSGEDTGEWAARRPDVAALPALAVPPPWTVWVEGRAEGDQAAGEPFFGQSYRARWTASAPAPAARLVIERNPALPPGAGISIQRVEVAP